MASSLQQLELLVTIDVIDAVRNRAKQQRPNVVWGMLFGTAAAPTAVYQAIPFRNYATHPRRAIQINYAEIAPYFKPQPAQSHTLLGYYIASSGRRVDHALDVLAFQDIYYVILLENLNGKLQWKAEAVNRDTRVATSIRLKQGTAQQVAHRVQQRAGAKRCTEVAAQPPEAKKTSVAASPATQTFAQRHRPLAGPSDLVVAPAPGAVAASLSIRQRRIKDFCQERAITTLVHFTRLQNLASILSAGLLPQTEIENRGIKTAIFNDTRRMDGCRGAISLSISFPNYRTFFLWQQRHPEPWVVLTLDARVLWELSCAFCNDNAAASAVAQIPIERRRMASALEGMFADFEATEGIIERAMLALPSKYPTNPQAEVLVFGSIAPSYIKTISFKTPFEMQRYRNQPEYAAWQAKFVTKPLYFESRSDYRTWKR